MTSRILEHIADNRDTEGFRSEMQNIVQRAYDLNYVIKGNSVHCNSTVFLPAPNTAWDSSTMRLIERLRHAERGGYQVKHAVTFGLWERATRPSQNTRVEVKAGVVLRGADRS